AEALCGRGGARAERGARGRASAPSPGRAEGERGEVEADRPWHYGTGGLPDQTRPYLRGRGCCGDVRQYRIRHGGLGDRGISDAGEGKGTVRRVQYRGDHVDSVF